LTIGLGPTDYASYTYTHYLGEVEDGSPAAYDDTTTAMCLRDFSAPQTWCQGAQLDTGNPTPYVETNLAPSSYFLPWGDNVEFIIEGADGCVYDRYSFLVGVPPKNSVEIRLVEAQAPYINPSAQFFFRYDVMIDPGQGIIALRKRQ
jgi:hypothetical protein